MVGGWDEELKECMVGVYACICVVECVRVWGVSGVESHLNSLIVKEGVNSCIAGIIVCFVHFYPELSPVWREICRIT